MKRLTCICLMMLSGLVAQERAPSPLVEKSKAMLQAWKTKDVAALGQALAKDFMSVGSEGKLHDRSELMYSAREGELQDFQAYNVRVLPVSDSVVIVTYDCIIKMPEGDAPKMAPRYQ